MKNIFFAAIFILLNGGFQLTRCDEPYVKEELRKAFKFLRTSAVNRLVVDNMNGSISVTGYNGDSVEILTHKTIRAESEHKMSEAREKVTVEFTEEPDRILVYVNAPWRCKDGGSNYEGWEYYGYDVECDFEIRVPFKTDFYLKTINDGDVTVKELTGDFDVKNVNGNIAMSEINGSGDVCTVNGDVKVFFQKNPQSQCKFKTINGEVNVQFIEDLSADFKLTTFNGEVYTDFTVQSLPGIMKTEMSRAGRKRYHNDRSFTVRAGAGGPELLFNTLNGNIYITKNEN